jgi:hypothetical protein
MKKVIFILAIGFAFLSFSNANSMKKEKNNQIETIVSESTQNKLLSLMNDGIVTSLSVTKITLDSCTLSAVVSYNGVSTTLSVTADDCYKAGAQIAQAVKGFKAEIDNK